MHLLKANVLGETGWAAKASQPTAYNTPCLCWWRWELGCSSSCQDVTKKELFSDNDPRLNGQAHEQSTPGTTITTTITTPSMTNSLRTSHDRFFAKAAATAEITLDSIPTPTDKT